MFSDCEIVDHSVSQGTILEPLIFLLYVNDFSSNISTTEKGIQSEVYTCIFYFDRKVAYIKKLIQFYKKKTEKFGEMNKISLSTKKTELIIFSCKNSDFRSIFNKHEVLTKRRSCTYLSNQIDRILFSRSS